MKATYDYTVDLGDSGIHGRRICWELRSLPRNFDRLSRLVAQTDALWSRASLIRIREKQ